MTCLFWVATSVGILLLTLALIVLLCVNAAPRDDGMP